MEPAQPIPVVSFAGRSNSGKTTFVEKLIVLLQDKGLRVACVKQHHHDVDVDVVGKDSWRYAQAGAACSIIATPAQVSLVHQVDSVPSIEKLAQMAADAPCDVLLAESFAGADTVDRYIVARIDRAEEPLLAPEETAGLITDDADLAAMWEAAGRPTFDINNVVSFAQYVISHYNLA